MRIHAAISFLVYAAIAVALSIVWQDTREEWYGWLLIVVVVFAAIQCVYRVLVLLWLGARRVRAIGYQLREDDILLRKGLLVRRFVAVPYGRMQLVDVTQGPLLRRFRLSTLQLHTAASGTNASIPGLDDATVQPLRDRLVQLAETRRAGL